jgi:foldase protein PrsA
LVAVTLLRRFTGLVLAGGLALAGAGCGSASPAAATIEFPEQAVSAGATSEDGGSATTTSTAEVRYGDTVTVDRSEFERELKALNENQPLQEASQGQGISGQGKKTVTPNLAAGWLTFIIQDKLISHEVERRRLQITPAVSEEARAQLASQYGGDAAVAAFPKWFQDRLTERNARALALRAALAGFDFSEDSLRKYYEDHKGDFGLNCASHILVKTPAEADAALARVKGGEDFAKVAGELSLDRGSKAKGGQLDCSPKGAFVPEFDEVASALPVGELSEPVQTQFGFHIIKLTDRKSVPYEEAREQVKALVNAETQTPYRQFLRQALTTVRVTVDKRYGTFEAPAPGQAPVVLPPSPPEPQTGRSDGSTPTSVPLEGELPGTPGTPTQPGG